MTADTSAKLLGAAQDEGDATVQDLKMFLAQRKFALQQSTTSDADRQRITGEMESAISDNAMSGVYEHVCSHLGWQVNDQALSDMKAANDAKIKEFDEKIAECEKNEGDEEVRDAMLARADYLCNIGNKEAAWEAYAAVEKKSPSPKHKIVIAFCKIRLEILLGNWTDVKALLDVAKDVCDKGGDWEKKNRLMVYEGVYCLAQRQFQRAAKLFLDSVVTFTTYELFDYERCIFYAVVAAVITLPRPELKKKVVDAPEVRTVLHKLPAAMRMLHALYYCKYQEFLPGFLAVVEQLEGDMLLHSHVRFYMREARVVVYQQYLASYKSVTMAAMAAAFGVSPEFLDLELSEFIVTGRLAAKIDKVSNVVETVGAFERQSNYNTLIKEGDLLLNRIQKLSKVVDVE